MNKTINLPELKEINLQKGEKLTVTFIDQTYEGLGVCKVSGNIKNTYYENFPIFVEDALPSEKGIIEITKINKTFGEAKLLKIFSDTTSINRIRPICENYNQCGGCNIMHMNYSSQLKFKQKVVLDAITRIGQIENIKVEPVIGMKNPLGYRNKVQMPVGTTLNNKAIVGFYKRNSHEVMPISKCYIQDEQSCEIANFVKNLLNEYKISVYNERNQEGLIRNIVVKLSQLTKEIMIILVSTSTELPSQELIIKKIINRYPMVSSIILNINNQKGSLVLSENNIVLFGKSTIEDELLGKKFDLGATSFFQVNHEQTEKLYQKVLDLGNFKKDDVVIDAYCGIGTISLIVAEKVKHVYGVEIIKEAILNAKNNALKNNIKNVTFEVGSAEEIVTKWAKIANAIVVDPPRKGLDTSLVKTIVDTKIKKVVYVSCNPSTLARDLKLFVEAKYQILTIQPVDMFPYTSHVETIVLLSHKSNNAKLI